MPLENKGTGMQRAFMLALLQVVAETSDNAHSGTVYGLDEPETWLHPRAQAQLSHALSKLSTNGRQILIFSHSPYMLKNIDADKDLVYIVKRTKGAHTITLEKNFRTQPQQYITLNAINYYAFKLATPEFLDELYGYFQELIAGPTSSLSEKQIRRELEQCDKQATHKWRNNKNPNNPPYAVQISVYVRNSIHHPENSLNASYTYEQLVDAIEELISAIEFKKTQP
ncbi:MAG: ATP-binding protein [Actinomyces graevenitzii]|uniref:ATP-binding protein n=1 Tax=Actinomyces graevenitzii TaxID=55565 RepID=A0A9E7DCC0_9ACTO|nr:MAG: ATP-binding protein [Actinomyces graevenitzii]